MFLSPIAAFFLTGITFINRVQALARTEYLSFGGVNHKYLQFIEPYERDEVITDLVNADTKVIRLFIHGYDSHLDPETELGEFDHSILDIYDDTIAAIHRISKGKTKVIIVPHNVHALRGESPIRCDAYCKETNGAWLDFYSRDEYLNAYKNRLWTIFHKYPSKNFGGAHWNTLNHTILGVDLQNEPLGGVYPLPTGRHWICEVARHMKYALGFAQNGIAVISGGVSGANSADGEQNWSDYVFDCEAIDVIGIHGYYSATEDESAGTPWLRMLQPGATLPGRALGDKLLLVEEMTFRPGPSGQDQKAADIWDQGNTLNFRGIPWIYSSITQTADPDSGDISTRGPMPAAMYALASGLRKATISPSHFDWTKFFPDRKNQKYSFTEVSPNPYYPRQGSCAFGCKGWLCDAMDSCEPGLVCRNNVCEACKTGCPGMTCNSKAPCQEPHRCVSGICQPCTARHSTTCAAAAFSLPNACPAVIDKDPVCSSGICNFCDRRTQSCRGSPCVRPADCDGDEECSWGFCKPCIEGCLGAKCRMGGDCKSGFCNRYQRCDFPNKTNQVPTQPRGWMGRKPPPRRGGPLGPGGAHPVMQAARPVVPKPAEPLAT